MSDMITQPVLAAATRNSATQRGSSDSLYPNLYVGTSGFSYEAWKGRFYPDDMPANRMLRFYARSFRAVEVNNTFRRMPKTSVLEKWAAEVPVDFKFALKAPQRITHGQRLKDAAESVGYLMKVATVLGRRLGPVLFQLPPHFKKDAARLAEFLDHLPAECQPAFEFRHPSWFDEEIFAQLRRHGAALCIAEAQDTLEVPFVSTTDWGYLRLRRLDYGDRELRAWGKRVLEQSWREVFVFFKHEDEAKGPQLAKRYLKLARLKTQKAPVK